MESVVNTEYQDIYRVDGGVLLVVNKFEYDESYGEHCCIWRGKDKPYHKLTKGLRVLKEDFIKEEYNHGTKKFEPAYTIPKGTVLFHSSPVIPTDRSNWSYEIKTTGNCFNGSMEEMLQYLEEIKKMIMG